MRTVEDYERIRKAYYVERLSMREICRQFHHGRNVIRKALERAEPEAYRLKEPRPAPVLAAYKPKIDVLIMESEQLPRKQRYTGRKIYQLAVAEHSRCLGREQDILDPLHYLGLLEQRPGAFEYAIPMRRSASQVSRRNSEPCCATSSGNRDSAPGWCPIVSAPTGFIRNSSAKSGTYPPESGGGRQSACASRPISNASSRMEEGLSLFGLPAGQELQRAERSLFLPCRIAARRRSGRSSALPYPPPDNLILAP